MSKECFEWDAGKDQLNQSKHGISFSEAQYAFAYPHRIIAKDISHSSDEIRYFCCGKTGGGIMTVRFTYRNKVIRIFGEGYWRKGKNIYEQKN